MTWIYRVIDELKNCEMDTRTAVDIPRDKMLTISYSLFVSTELLMVEKACTGVYVCM